MTPNYFLDYKISLDLEEYDRLIQVTTRNIANNISIFYSYIFRAIAYFAKSDYEKAILDIASAKQNKTYDLDIYKYIGEELRFKYLYDQALVVYKEGVKENPNSAFFHFMLGEMKGLLRDYSGALNDFSSTLRLDENYWEAWHNTGICWAHLNNFNNAIFCYNKSLELNPENYACYGNLAEILLEQKNYLQAIKFCDLAIANLKHGNLFATRAFAMFYIGEYSKAISDSNTALSYKNETNNHHRAFLARAMSFWALGHKKEAIQDFHSCIDIAPWFLSAYTWLANAYYEIEEINEVPIVLLRAAEQYHPEDGNILFSLGNYYSTWYKRNVLTNYATHILSKFKGEEPIKTYCGERVFLEKEAIAKAYFFRAFKNMFDCYRTDLNEIEDSIDLSIFVGNSKYLLDIIENETLCFVNPDLFSDKASDCLLLHPINQSKLCVNVSFESIRIRCCSMLASPKEIASAVSMWDRFANGHKGLCFTLSFPKNWFLENMIYARKIAYKKTDKDLKIESPEQVVEDGLFIKSYGYSDENEFRLLKFGNFKEDIIQIPFFNKNNDQSVQIKTVYIGLNTDSEIKNKILNLVSGTTINVIQMKYSSNLKLNYEDLKQP